MINITNHAINYLTKDQLFNAIEIALKYTTNDTYVDLRIQQAYEEKCVAGMSDEENQKKFIGIYVYLFVRYIAYGEVFSEKEVEIDFIKY